MSDTHSTDSSENNADYFQEHPETTQWLFRRMLNKFIPDAKTPYEVVCGINKLCSENNTPNVNVNVKKLVDYSSSSESDGYSSSEFSDEELLSYQVPQKSGADNGSDSESCTSSGDSESSTSSDYSNDSRIYNVKQINASFTLLFVMFLWCSITLFLTAQFVDVFKHMFRLRFTVNADSLAIFLSLLTVVLCLYYKFTQYVSYISASNFVCVVIMFSCTLMCSFWVTSVFGYEVLIHTTPMLKSILFAV